MSDGPDHDALYQLAESQAGYFTAEQARRVGFSWERLSYYARHGDLRRIVRGVYRLSRFPASRFEDLYVAWLRTGPDSVISHDSALAVYGLSDVLPSAVHVTVPRTASRRRPDLSLHTNKLSSDETSQRVGLPVTTVPRTVADAAASGMAEEQVRQAIEEALERGLTTAGELTAQVKKRGGRGARLVREVLQSA